MTVSTIASIAANLSPVTTAQASKPAAVLSSLVAATPTTTTDPDDSADVSLQSQIAQFRVASQSIAVGNSVLATASAGGDDISREVGALQDLAQQAANVPLSPNQRAQIDAEFQAIRSRINNIAATTSYNNDNLLDGSATASADLTDKALFQGANPNLQTVANSQAAVQQVAQAQDYTNQQVAQINTLQSGVDYASSTVQTALQNQAAAQSTLDDSDFETTASTGTGFPPGLDVQAAQTTRLPDSLLGLLSE
jgi:flagellin